MEVTGNYGVYRERLRTSEGVVIPFLGVILRDLVFIEEGNKDITGAFLNVEKIELAGDILSQLGAIQDVINLSYSSFKMDKDIQSALKSMTLPVPDDPSDVIYNLSIAAEPPAVPIVVT